MNNSNSEATRFEAAITKVFRLLNHSTMMDPLIMLPISQVRLMRALQDGPRTPSDLADSMRISASAVTQLTNRLVKAGMVERAEDSKDRRVRHLRLSPLGAKLLDEKHKRRIDRAEKLLEQLSPDDQRVAFESLENVIEASKAIYSSCEPDCHALSAELQSDSMHEGGNGLFAEALAKVNENKEEG